MNKDTAAPITAPITALFGALADQIRQASELRADARSAREATRYLVRRCAETLADYVQSQPDRVAAKAGVQEAISGLKGLSADTKAVWASILKDIEVVLTIRARLQG